MRARRTSILAAITAAFALIATTAAIPSAPAAVERQHADKRVLKKYAADTWKSFVAMTDPATGLPADNIAGNLDPATRSGFTSPTNIGAYLWSTVAARDTGLIGKREARHRMAQTLDSIADLERHEDSGMFYNWYDPATGAKLRIFPTSGDTIKPFLSSVDNGWLATGLLLAARADRSLARQADRSART